VSCGFAAAVHAKILAQVLHYFHFILGLDLLMWFAPPNLRWLFLLSGLVPWLALLLAGYGLGMAAIIEFAWRQSQPVDE